VIVQCPYCSTRYQVDTGRLTGPNPMLKCSRCRHIFPAPGSKRPPPATPKPTEPTAESLTLPFEDSAWKDEAEPSPGPDFDISEPEEGFTLGTGDEPEEESVAPPPPTEPDATPAAHARPLPEDEEEIAVKRDDEDEDDEEELELEQDMPVRRPRRPARPRGERQTREGGRKRDGRERGKMWALLIFLMVVVGSYAMLTRALFASPALCDRLIGRLPLVGTLGDDRLLTRKVALSEVVGSYQRIKDGKEVFVITGKALNTAPVALHGVQISGTLYNRAGQGLDQKTISCGNVISAKVLKDLTPQEVSILQKLSPPKRFMIEPGESSTFVVVFMDPPHDAVEFSARVVAAQRQA
jgi:predicted Zn finger-like uncharacterized protein